MSDDLRCYLPRRVSSGGALPHTPGCGVYDADICMNECTVIRGALCSRKRYTVWVWAFKLNSTFAVWTRTGIRRVLQPEISRVLSRECPVGTLTEHARQKCLHVSIRILCFVHFFQARQVSIRLHGHRCTRDSEAAAYVEAMRSGTSVAEVNCFL